MQYLMLLGRWHLMLVAQGQKQKLYVLCRLRVWDNAGIVN